MPAALLNPLFRQSARTPPAKMQAFWVFHMAIVSFIRAIASQLPALSARVGSNCGLGTAICAPTCLRHASNLPRNAEARADCSLARSFFSSGSSFRLYNSTRPSSLPDLIQSVKEQGLEGLVAKRRDSVYEPALRSGAWQKMRVNQAQEFVIGGYTIGGRTFDALVLGYYDGDRLMYAARMRNGFTPTLREELMRRFKGLETPKCPFANLPEAKSGRWGQGLTAAKMKDCRWLAPVRVGQFEFVEWTPEGHLRHSRFLGLRADKDAREVRREMS